MTIALSELHAALFQALITAGLCLLAGALYARYRRPYLLWWTIAWSLYLARIVVISAFLIASDERLLFVHQVLTGWTALALLWAALLFSQNRPWRSGYLWFALFPLVWSYVAIYRLDSFLTAAWPAVVFLSGATFWTGWVFLRHHRRVDSPGARLLAVAFLLWAAHHLDYPLLRARGAWNPWGYYLDIALMLTVGGGILRLVIDELGRGLATLSAISGELQGGDLAASTNDLLARPLTLRGVRGSALYIGDAHTGRFVAAAGTCAGWMTADEHLPVRESIAEALTRREPVVSKKLDGGVPDDAAFYAVLPLFSGSAVTGALAITGDARDPFTALDDDFLLALGRHIGAAIERADLLHRLDDRTRKLEQLSVRVLHQQEAERRKISLELHDETAQLLAAVKMQVGLLQESADPDIRARLERVLVLIDQGIRSIRRVSSDLRPPLLDDVGLLPALRALLDDFAERTGVAVAFQAPEVSPSLSADAEVALFRALQEALSNVARHARATRVDVALLAEADTVALSVRDDGRGLSSELVDGMPANAKLGIAGMRERVTAVGGELALRSCASGGLEVRLRVPVAAAVSA
ncbi:MAG: GAF domain-containing sensor histidine kinase [Gemmatimonadaceae bacterium]